MKNIIIDGKTPTSFSDNTIKRTSVSINPMLWGLACCYFGSATEARKHVVGSMKNQPTNSEAINNNLLTLIAKPSLISKYENDLEIQFDIEDY